MVSVDRQDSNTGPDAPTTDLDKLPVVELPITSLLPADSPRLEGEDLAHSQAMARSDARLPPIVVHRLTMRVIDGMHRLQAAALRGHDTIEVRFFDGDEAAAFVLAVQLNSAHGLPLSQADRTAAANRILQSHPRWSDRTIATTTGLSAKTVSRLRHELANHEAQPMARIGRDGRVRPVDPTAGRRLAVQILRENPDATLREIATSAGIAQATALDVRKKLRQGQDPVATRVRGVRNTAAKPKRENIDGQALLIVQALKKDPALRFTDAGRALLRLLDGHTLSPGELTKMVEGLPPYCLPTVAQAAWTCAETWTRFAHEVERRHRTN